MSRAPFVLIDHSLASPGGHHYEYALHVLQEAERAGYRPVLAAQRTFRRVDCPTSWQVLPLFRFDTYAPYSSFVGRSLRRPFDVVPIPGARDFGPLEPLRRWWHGVDRRRRGRDFTDACRTLFRHVPFQPGMHVFVPTLNEFDFGHLVEFLASEPASVQVPWHLQFHFGLLDGRPPEFSDPQQQRRLAVLSDQFAANMARVPRHRLTFWSTTDEMADQYNRLESATFRMLSYPVNHRLRAKETAAEQARERPRRVTCAGYLRPEKGRELLADVVADLWTDHFATGRLQLQVQAPVRKLRRMLPNVAVGRTADRTPILSVPHPLPMAEYAELIRHTDIALFLYDSHRYYGRCSGILAEMLAAGVPVIVPAGCWLSDQIAEAESAYANRCAAAGPITGTEQVRHRTTEPVATESGDSLLARLTVPTGTQDAVVTLRWQAAIEPGTYLRLDARQFDSTGTERQSWQHTLTQLPTGGTSVLVRLDEGVQRLELHARNAFDHRRLTVESVHVRFLGPSATHARRPLGSVGLILSRPADLGRMLRDVLEHFDHYRRNARSFAGPWRDAHHPRRVIERLTSIVMPQQYARAA